MNELQAEHINFLMDAFSNISSSLSADPKLANARTEIAPMIEEFLPRLLEQSKNELYRSKIGDVLTVVQGNEKLWQAGIIKDRDLSAAH